MLTKLGEKYTEATFGGAPSWSQNTELFPTSDVAFFRIFAFSTNLIFYIALTTTWSLIDPNLLFKMLLQRYLTMIQHLRFPSLVVSIVGHYVLP